MKRLAIFVLIALLFLTGSTLASAEEDPGYLLEDSTTFSAGFSTTEDYELLSVIGEPIAETMTSEEGYTLASGFLSSPPTYLLRLPMIFTKP
jgi:hypothetical protein